MIPVIFRNSSFVVIDKPAGLSVHNAADVAPVAGPVDVVTSDTFAGTDLITLLEKQLGCKVLPSHRLDKETSGLMVLAFDSKSAADIQSLFDSSSDGRQIQKKYFGVLRASVKGDDLVWKQALSDKAEGFKNPTGLKINRKACETRVKVLGRNRYFTLCEFEIKTGRQHQIRKHAAFFKHAIVGDTRYGERNFNTKIASIYGTERMFLQACYLKFTLNDEAHEFSLPTEPEFLRLMVPSETSTPPIPAT